MTSNNELLELADEFSLKKISSTTPGGMVAVLRVNIDWNIASMFGK